MDTNIAIITGTTSGIGEAMSHNLASRGYNLVLVSRNEDKLQIQKEVLSKKYGIDIHIIAKNLANEEASDEILEYLKKNKLAPNILINNAGFNECGKFSETDLNKELEMIKVHIITLTKLTKFFIKNHDKNKKGYILNLGSTGSYAPFPLDAVYAASKAYILNFSLAINSECKDSNISITTVTPGATETLFATKAEINESLLFSLFVMNPNDVAKIAINAMFKKRAMVTPGLYNKILVLTMKLTPYFILQLISHIFFKKLTKK